MLSKMDFEFKPRGWVHVKGKGNMLTYLVVGKKMRFSSEVQPQLNSRNTFASVVYGMIKRRHNSAKNKPGNFLTLTVIISINSKNISLFKAAVHQEFTVNSLAFSSNEFPRVWRQSFNQFSPPLNTHHHQSSPSREIRVTGKDRQKALQTLSENSFLQHKLRHASEGNEFKEKKRNLSYHSTLEVSKSCQETPFHSHTARKMTNIPENQDEMKN